MNDDDGLVTIVIDNGSGNCKAGFSGDNAPTVVFPTVVSRSTDQQRSFVGHEAKEREFTFKYPIERGIVTNWDDMETLWRHTFYKELNVKPEKHPVLLSEVALNPGVNREKMAEIMFEKFNTPALYIAIQGVLSLYATSRVSGIVLDCGEGITQVVSVNEGIAVPEAILTLDFAGQDLTDYLVKKYNFPDTETSKDYFKLIKEKFCYLALDFEKEIEDTATSTTLEEIYILPDGREIKIGDERFKCPEMLFKSGLQQLIINSIISCEIDARKDLFSNVILCGGSTRIPGFAKRIKKELETLAPYSVNGKIFELVKPDYSAWSGGSALSSMPSFRHKCISKSEYRESGRNIVHRKC